MLNRASALSGRVDLAFFDGPKKNTRADMGIGSKLKAEAAVLREYGPTDLLLRIPRYMARRVVENYYERHFGIYTRGDLMQDTLGVNDPDAVHYAPSPYLGFFKAMKFVGADLPSSTFVDYGSGLGRIVICAATLPFKRVIGVELVEELNRRAKLNIAAACGRFTWGDVPVLQTASVAMPADVSVQHFYNPFLNQTLRATVAALARSLRESPREAWIVFGSPWQMSSVLAAGEIIPLSWQKWSGNVHWPFYKDFSKRDPHACRYFIYRIEAR